MGIEAADHVSIQKKFNMGIHKSSYPKIASVLGRLFPCGGVFSVFKV